MESFEPTAILSALADETRLRLALLLVAEEELCVCELTHALGQSQPKISRHLAILREMGLVKDRREGVWIHYRMNPDLPCWVQELLTALRKGPGETKTFASNRSALSRARVRPPSRFCV